MFQRIRDFIERDAQHGQRASVPIPQQLCILDLVSQSLDTPDADQHALGFASALLIHGSKHHCRLSIYQIFDGAFL